MHPPRASFINSSACEYGWNTSLGSVGFVLTELSGTKSSILASTFWKKKMGCHAHPLGDFHSQFSITLKDFNFICIVEFPSIFQKCSECCELKVRRFSVTWVLRRAWKSPFLTTIYLVGDFGICLDWVLTHKREGPQQIKEQQTAVFLGRTRALKLKINLGENFRK